MAETVIIDIEAQYRDKTSSGVEKSADDMERLRRKMADTEEAGKKANASLEKIASTAASIARKTISIPVKVIDYATKPLRSLLNYATSLKGILTGIVMGKAGQVLFSNPLGLADQYSSALAGFTTLFNSAEQGQAMMNQLDEFARTTPFKTSNVIAQTQKMLAMGWDANNLIRDMTIIGDAAAASGKGDEGMERIVLALAQIKSKGKLSTEELNQLAEAGIGAKGYIAEGLGYGTDDAGLQQMTKALESGKIGGNAAVEMLLAGMQRDYGGMMEQLATNTAEGIMSNIQDTFEINIFRKWGQGLQEGAKRGLGAMADMLDENQDRLSQMGDQLQDIAATLSNKLADAAEQGIGTMMDVMESEAFNNASLGGKAKMLWDEVIAKPFDAWWESDGQAFLGNVAGKIGEGLGKFYNGAITTILGIDADAAAEGGVNIGAKFAEGFLEGFNAEKVWEAIKNAFSNALKIIPGGEEATTGSWISAALLGYGGFKAAGALKPLLSGVGGLGKSAVGAAAGSTKMAELAILLGGGNLAGNASLSAGALSALGVGSVAGGAVGGLGLVSGIADLTKALNESSTAKEQSVSGWSAASKFGMVGAGAAAGAGIGSIFGGIGAVPGALIGAGIGGLGALFGGSKAGEAISDLLDGTSKIKDAQKAIEDTGTALGEAAAKASAFAELKGRYEDLTKQIEGGKLNTEDLQQAQSDLADTIQDLAELYPDLITQYDIENGKLSEKLGLIQDITEEERKQARRESQMAVYEGEKQLPGLESKIQGSQEEQDAALGKYDQLIEKAQKLQELAGLQSQARGLDKDSAAYKAIESQFSKGLEDFNEQYRSSYSGLSNLADAVDRIMESANRQLEKAKGAGAELDELMTSYQEIYQGFLENALNPESLDEAGGLSGLLSKIEEIQKIQSERLELEKQLAELDKGSKEYDATAQKIDEAKSRQQELTDAVEPFKSALEDVLRTVEEINTQFELLGGKRLSLGDMGLTSAANYVGYAQSGKGTVTTKALSMGLDTTMETALNYILNKNGYAKGTLSAPAGWAWVGEDGPELVKMRGGERVYNAESSRRIAEETARLSGGQSAGGGGNTIQVELGGLNVNITGGGDSGDIMEQLRRHLPELGNELCAQIATQLSRTFANLPTNVEGI